MVYSVCVCVCCSKLGRTRKTLIGAAMTSYDVMDRKMLSSDANNKAMYAVNNNLLTSTDLAVTSSPQRMYDANVTNCLPQRRSDPSYLTKSPRLDTRSAIVLMAKKPSKNVMNFSSDKTVQKHSTVSESVSDDISTCSLLNNVCCCCFRITFTAVLLTW